MLSSAMTLSNPKQRGLLRQPSLIHTSRSAACICQLSRRRISVPCHAFQLSLDNIYDKMEFGLKLYNFEPEYTEEELAELATASDESSGNDAVRNKHAAVHTGGSKLLLSKKRKRAVWTTI